VVLVAVIAVVVLAGRSGSTTTRTTSPTPATPGPGATPGTIVYPVRIVLECEAADKIEDKMPDGTPVWRIKEQSEGTVIRYIEIPDGWIDKSCYKEVKEKAGALPGKATYSFDAPRDDMYYVNLRARWHDTCGNSVWVKVDDGPYVNLEDQNGEITKTSYKWAWHQVELEGRPKPFELKAGKHALTLATREDGPLLDQLVITTEASRMVGEAAKKK
jgi:hypothetical protein